MLNMNHIHLQRTESGGILCENEGLVIAEWFKVPAAIFTGIKESVFVV